MLPRGGQVVHRKSVEQLRSFCRGEMSARDSYLLALTDPDLSDYRETLSHCMQSHQWRAELLAQEIERVGGDAPQSSGPWGTLVDIVERAAMGLGKKAALKVLREGEDHGVRDYGVDIGKLDPPQRALVETYILPAQLETRRALTSLEQTFS